MMPTLKPLLLAATVTLGASLWSMPTTAAVPPMNHHAELDRIVQQVSADNLRRYDAALVGFGTRNTVLQLDSKTRGIGAARDWLAGQFKKISADCGGCLEIVRPSQVFTGPRIPQKEGVRVENVVAIQRGTSDPDRVIVLTAHIDSINSNVFKSHWKDNTGDAPGANDDASGVSALLETARVLSHYKFPATLVFSADSGEEQGLYGGRIIAQYAVDHGWKVEVDLNNDMVGNSHGGNGVHDPHTIRLYSEDTKTNETPRQAAYRRSHGGGSDTPSRNVVRYMATLADEYLTDFHVRMVYMTDRWGRSGDEVPFLAQGFPAIRFAEAGEAYNRQHQVVRDEDGIHYGDEIEWVDFDYLANVTRLDAITMASLAMAPAPVSDLEVKGAVRYDTTLTWTPRGDAATYNAWWRETTAPQWEHRQQADSAGSVVLKDVIIDNYFFGVSAVSKDGWESPVVFPGYAGSFERSPRLDADGKPVGGRYPDMAANPRFEGRAVGEPSWANDTANGGK
jgi:hypothetical protein